MKETHQLLVFLPGSGYRELALVGLAKRRLLVGIFHQVTTQIHDDDITIGGDRHQLVTEVALQTWPDIALRRHAVDLKAELLDQRCQVIDQSLVQQVGKFIGTGHRQVDVGIRLQVEQGRLLRNHPRRDPDAAALFPLLLQFEVGPQQGGNVSRFEGNLDDGIGTHFTRGNQALYRSHGAFGLLAGHRGAGRQQRGNAEQPDQCPASLSFHDLSPRSCLSDRPKPDFRGCRKAVARKAPAVRCEILPCRAARQALSIPARLE